jgi:activator of HSP90 ATPase
VLQFNDTAHAQFTSSESAGHGSQVLVAESTVPGKQVKHAVVVSSEQVKQDSSQATQLSKANSVAVQSRAKAPVRARRASKMVEVLIFKLF